MLSKVSAWLAMFPAQGRLVDRVDGVVTPTAGVAATASPRHGASSLARFSIADEENALSTISRQENDACGFERPAYLIVRRFIDFEANLRIRDV